MCLIRGLGGLCPCTMCLVPKEDLDKHIESKLRTPQHTVDVLAQANAVSTKAEKNDILKQFGMQALFVSR